MSTTEITELRRTIGQLRQCVGALRARYGDDAAAIRRLTNDVDRLDIDSADLDNTPVPAQPRSTDRHEVVVVPDTPYDPALWEGADDEGVGGHLRDQS